MLTIKTTHLRRALDLGGLRGYRHIHFEDGWRPRLPA